MDTRNDTRRSLLICILLVAITSVAFLHVFGNGFITAYDDGVYVTDNRHIQQGLNRESLLWAFTTFHAANWHPLTWLSHMVDYRFYGPEPAGHHLTNLLFHLANTLLLFLALSRMTKSPWRSAFVAALFAIHPLHVESVAWVAERKDVLSSFFWMLALYAYARYTERPGIARYVLVFVALAFGLMAKPMVVTLPLVLLLLDYWPLGRLRFEESGGRMVRKLVLEKLPLLALAGASSVVTYLAQHRGGATNMIGEVPPGVRVANAVLSCILYIRKALWPSRLAVIYPLEFPPAWEVAVAAVLLASLFALALSAGRRHPSVAVGWLWYVVTLIPVLGFVQFGMQAMADRYTYLPLIGLFVIAAWGVPDLLAGRGAAFAAADRSVTCRLVVPAAIVIMALAACTWFQVALWRDNITLFSHAARVTRNNCVALNNVGVALYEKNETDQAIQYFSSAVQIQPTYTHAQNNLAAALIRQGKIDEAIPHILQALKIAPSYDSAHANLAQAYYFKGSYAEAWREIELCRSYGGVPPAGFVLALSRKMPEPGR